LFFYTTGRAAEMGDDGLLLITWFDVFCRGNATTMAPAGSLDRDCWWTRLLLLKIHAGFSSYCYFFFCFFQLGVSSKGSGETYMIRRLFLILC
jgi:hypothetical protein